MAIKIATNQIKDDAITAALLADNAVGSSAIDLTATYTFTGAVRGQAPSNTADFTTKSYVDGLVGSGVFWKEPAEVASTANVNLSNPGTASFDGVTISSGDRILIRAQSTASENGIYLFNGSSSALSRTTDADNASELQGAAIFVSKGNTFADQAFTQTADDITLGSTALTWVRFSGLGTITAGSGLTKTGDQLDVSVDDSSIEINSDSLRVKASGITDAMLAGSISAAKLAGSIPDSKLSDISSANKVLGSAVQLNAAGALSNDTGLKVAVDDSSIEISSNTLSVKAAGISNAMLGGSIADSKLLQITSADKVAGSAVQLAGSGGLEDSSGLKISAAGVTNAMLGGSIADSKLLQISSADKVAGSAVQLKANGGVSNDAGLTVNVDNSSIELNSGNLRIKANGVGTSAVANLAITQGKLANGSVGSTQLIDSNVTTAKIADSAVSAAKVSFATQVDPLSPNGSATNFDLSNTIPAGFEAVLVFRNGLFLNQVASTPSGVDQFVLNRTGGAGGNSRIELGSAPAADDSLVCYYIS